MAADKQRTPHVLIVGAGLAGISTAIQLKRQLGFENFTIYERATSVGGTWRDNTYPGCGSDVPGHWYSLSTDLNPNWSAYYCGQPELRAYWEDLWYKYDLPSHTKLGWDVVASEWDTTLQRYKVTVRNVETGEERIEEAEATIYAIGGFMSPVYPKELKGKEDFKGIQWHSARWRHDISLRNKRVGVIGNGCSAAQFVPEIAQNPTTQIINFCRTPNWFVPRSDLRYPGWMKWIFAHVPFVMRVYRNAIMARSDMSFLIFRKDNKLLVSLAKKLLTKYITMKAPKDQVKKLVPDYSPGCKRIIVDPGYLDALHKPNVSLEWTHIDKIVEDGILLKNGKHLPLDVIIFGTGYSLEAADMLVKGRNGQTIREYFQEKGGPTAYLGSMVPGFPNMFTLLGPNVASGHASVIFSQEAQINLALQLIKPIISGQAKSFEVRADVTDKYNDWLQGRLSRSVWTDCSSYYHVAGSSNSKIVATFPGPVSLFWWLARKPKWGEYKAVGDEAWVKKRKANKVKNGILFTLTLVVAAGLALHLQGDHLVPLLQKLWPAFSTRFV